jgi:hypothetical protein
MIINSDPLIPRPDNRQDYLDRLVLRLSQIWRTTANAVNERIIVQKDGTRIGVAPTINLIAGAGVTITVADNPGNGRIDITISAP